MQDKIVFETGWESFFASHQLHCFDGFFNYGEGRTINENTKRNVVVLELDDNGQHRTFYMKRFSQPHFKDMLAGFMYHGALCSQAEVEWRNAKILLEHGIETYHPVCYGVQSLAGIERRSFFITEQIEGPCLTDYLAESWASLEESQRNDLVIRLGKLFRKIHSARIRLPDSYIWHVYRVMSDTAPGGFELGMIDLHRMKLRQSGNRSAAKDLGAFLFSLPDGFMDEALRSVFMDSYLENGSIQNQNAFSRRVKQWEEKISNRRTRELSSIV
ncbi:MAG: lipopolysaccharide kinase InaA family protein [Phycisphaerae bacterium]|nr:lipopolysaccharide kinase InaA family protein [Phycisphaerae bacterium]